MNDMDIQYAKDLIAQEITSCLMEDEHIDMKSAMGILYNSQLYEKLQDSDTGLYYQSPYYCYELLQHELKYGKLG